MEKIDWKKPLRVHPSGKLNAHQKVYTFKSGKQRVVWIDDLVYPVDDYGLADATVTYVATPAVRFGERIVENVPEEPKCFVGLERQRDGTYVLFNGGVPGTRAEVWDAACQPRPEREQWWIVDTRKSAKPPKAIEHDPKDWTVVRVYSAGPTRSFGMMTESEARSRAAQVPGDVKIVRVRTTPTPVDTSRYVQLWRHNVRDPWRINAYADERQEFTWGRTEHRGENPLQCAIKVRD